MGMATRSDFIFWTMLSVVIASMSLVNKKDTVENNYYELFS